MAAQPSPTSERTVKFDGPLSERTTGTSERGTVVARGAAALGKLLKMKSNKSRKYDESDTNLDEEEGDQFESSQSLRKTRTMRKKVGKSKGAIQAELQAEEEQRQRELQETLTVSERGYLPVHVRTKLLELNGLPPTPFAQGSRGVVLFADISGFTNLSKELRLNMPALEAASKLANRICTVLKELTDICLEFEGDVAKFAGDALLCIWENHDDGWMLERAKACAVSMLNKVKQVDAQLDLHGGIAMGNILHFHLGDKRQEQLWYLVTGDAVVRAANLVDSAPRGQILYEPRRSGSSFHDGSSSVGGSETAPPTLTRLPSTLAYESIDKDTKTMIMPTFRRQKSRLDDEMPLKSPSDPLGQGRRISADFQDSPEGPNGFGTRTRTNTEDDPFLNMRINPKGRSYIPRTLRNILMSGRIESGEMRNRVATLFAALPSLSLLEDELVSNTVSSGRERLLNETFAHMSTILRQGDGAFRDLLFDDKGCIFIAVFGAYSAVEMPELKALKAARRMLDELEVDDLKIGVSVGTCFVGLVGNDVRHDMIVMGHEVNMAARLMSKAAPSTILVSPRIQTVTRDFYKFEEIKVQLKKKPQPGDLLSNASARRFQNHENDLTGDGAGDGRRDSETTYDPNGMVSAHRPVSEVKQRASFTTQYRYSQQIPDEFFIGRKTELGKLQAHITKASGTTKVGALCMVSGPRGYGKSWLIREFRHKIDDKFASAMGVAFELNVLTPLYVFRQIFERLFEVFEGMPKSRATAELAKWATAGIKPDTALMDKMFPYMTKFINPPRRISTQQSGSSLSVMALGRIIGGSMRLTSTTQILEEEAASRDKESKDSSASPLKKLPSLEVIERSSSGGGHPNALVEEIRQSSSNMSPGLGPAHQTSQQRVASMQLAQGTSPKLEAVKPRLISTRNLLEGFTRVGSQKSLGTINLDGPTSPSPSASAAPSTSAADEKKKLARKQSRAEINLVMGQKELDPLVKFISGLLQIAADDATKTGKKGLLIILEDIQWMDAVSLQVFMELLEKMTSSPKSFLPSVYFVLSCRNADPDKPETEYYSSHPSDMRPLLEQRLLERAREVKQFTSVELDVLSRDEVDQLVTKLFVKNAGETVSNEVLELVYQNSGGMPNAVADVISIIRQNDGAIFLDAHTNQWKWKMVSKTGKHNAAQGVLREARQAFVLRVDNLSLATRDLLKIAACLCDDKQKFRLRDIADVITRDLENKSRYLRAETHSPSVEYISDKLQEAVAAGLLKYRKAGLFSATEDWAFASYAIADTVLDMVPMDRLQEIRAMKKDLENEKTGQAAEGLFREFLGTA